MKHQVKHLNIAKRTLTASLPLAHLMTSGYTEEYLHYELSSENTTFYYLLSRKVYFSLALIYLPKTSSHWSEFCVLKHVKCSAFRYCTELPYLLYVATVSVVEGCCVLNFCPCNISFHLGERTGTGVIQGTCSILFDNLYLSHHFI